MLGSRVCERLSGETYDESHVADLQVRCLARAVSLLRSFGEHHAALDHLARAEALLQGGTGDPQVARELAEAAQQR
jgi:hypothetical protein